MNDYEFPQLFNYGYGWRFRLMVFENDDCDTPIFESYFCAPSMVLARHILSNFRAEFLVANGITDDNFVYDLYNLSLGDRRKIK